VFTWRWREGREATCTCQEIKPDEQSSLNGADAQMAALCGKRTLLVDHDAAPSVPKAICRMAVCRRPFAKRSEGRFRSEALAGIATHCHSRIPAISADSMTPTPFLATALEAAKAAAEVINRYYQRNLEVTIKADKSPVTQADVETERVIRSILSAAFPEHGFYGEETGQRALDAEYLWLVDPIDGTKAFVREYPMFSTQIALMHRGRLIVGVSSAPVYGEIAYGEIGKGAWLNDKQLKVSDIASIESCAISAGNLKTLANSARWSNYGRLVARANRIRGYGDFLHYHLLAAGKIDVVIESDVNILDIAALAVIVEAAGGTFTDLEGQALSLSTTSVLASNAVLHPFVRAALS
jgi:histidinol-phosphatase